jgi:tRNA threonylcarbamoyladenosine biosynthesis protein TsaB
VIILALDTCLNACAGAVVRDGVMLAKRIEPMQRGHQERIAGMTAELMAAADLAYADLDRIAVTVGPGSFTGLRIGLAFAKGLGVALDRPCVGVGVLDVLGRQAPFSHGRRVLAALDARGGAVHAQMFEDGAPQGPAVTLPIDDAGAFAAPDVMIGGGAALLQQHFPGAKVVTAEACDPAIVAALGVLDPPAPAHPIYMRAAYA